MWSEVGGVQAFYAVILSEIEGCYKQVKNDNLRIADDLKRCMKCRVLIAGCFDRLNMTHLTVILIEFDKRR